MLGREGSLQTYPEIGVPDSHHPLTHHRDQPDLVEKVTRINAFHVELFAYFLGKLKAAAEGEGSLLDHATIVYGSGLADGNRHTHEDLPILVAGGGAGRMAGGRHVVYPRETPLTNLFLTLLGHAGLTMDQVGDSSGQIAV
jgi:hypothetical protein